jgi:hypothetical protein
MHILLNNYGHYPDYHLSVPVWVLVLTAISAAILAVCWLLPRRFLKVLTATAFVTATLFLATAALWLRSYWIADCLNRCHSDLSNDRFESSGGEIVIMSGGISPNPMVLTWTTYPGEPHFYVPLEFEWDHEWRFLSVTFPHWSLMLFLAIPPIFRIRRRPAREPKGHGFPVAAPTAAEVKVYNSPHV